jgi:hypothetical protein
MTRSVTSPSAPATAGPTTNHLRAIRANRVDLHHAVCAHGIELHRQAGGHPRALEPPAELLDIGIKKHVSTWVLVTDRVLNG